MLKHRCPWCGEYIPFHFPVCYNNFWRYIDPMTCPKCKKPHISYGDNTCLFISLAALAIVFIAAYFIKMFQSIILHWLLGIIAFIMLVVIVYELFQEPYFRITDKKDTPAILSKCTVKVILSWEKRKKEGLWLPRFQVLDGEIFPACFMDKDGTPISTALCVILEKIRWTNSHRCTCNISFVLDDIPEKTFFQKENRFYLYHNYRKIAEGTILGTEKHKLKRTGD